MLLKVRSPSYPKHGPRKNFNSYSTKRTLIHVHTVHTHSDPLRIPPPNRLPRVPLRHRPVPRTPPRPIDLADRLPLRLDKRRERTEPRARVRTPADARQRDRPVVDHDTNVGLGCLSVVVRRGTREHWRRVSTLPRDYERNLRWNWTLVANGARSDTLNDRCAGMWSAGSGPDAASVVRFSAVRTVQHAWVSCAQSCHR
jgi:hypothetical protein